MDESISQKIRNASFLASCLVVLIHIPCSNVPYSATWLLDAILGRGLCTMAVPYFFVVSGFFLARSYKSGCPIKDLLHKRIKTIVVPFIIWESVFFILISMGYVVTGHTVLIEQLGGWGRILGINPFRTPLLGPLWYLRALLIFVVFIPALYRVLLRFPKVWLLLSFSLMCFLQQTSLFGKALSSLFYFTISAEGLFYFSLGICFAVHENVPKRRNCYYFLALIVGLVLLGIGVYEQKLEWVLRPFWTLLLLTAFWKMVPSSPWPCFLTKLSFPLYVIHFPVIYFAKYLFVNDVFGWISITICAYLGSTGVILGLRKFSGRFYAIAFGGR